MSQAGQSCGQFSSFLDSSRRKCRSSMLASGGAAYSDSQRASAPCTIQPKAARPRGDRAHHVMRSVAWLSQGVRMRSFTSV